MKIVTICDQRDCTYNENVPNGLTGNCTHTHPYVINRGTECLSMRLKDNPTCRKTSVLTDVDLLKIDETRESIMDNRT